MIVAVRHVAALRRVCLIAPIVMTLLGCTGHTKRVDPDALSEQEVGAGLTSQDFRSVCQRMAPGFAEMMRVEGYRKTRKAILSRGTAGVRGKTLIINLPGSPKAVTESLEVILDVLPHAVKMMLGGGH